MSFYDTEYYTFDLLSKIFTIWIIFYNFGEKYKGNYAIISIFLNIGYKSQM